MYYYILSIKYIKKKNYENIKNKFKIDKKLFNILNHSIWNWFSNNNDFSIIKLTNNART